MAQDKGKKNTGGDDFAKPSEAPSGGDGWSLTDDDNRGALLLITPLRSERIDDKFSKEPGATKEIIVADVVVLRPVRARRVHGDLGRVVAERLQRLARLRHGLAQ